MRTELLLVLGNRKSLGEIDVIDTDMERKNGGGTPTC